MGAVLVLPVTGGCELALRFTLVGQRLQRYNILESYPKKGFMAVEQLVGVTETRAYQTPIIKLLGEISSESICEGCPGLYQDGCCMANLAGNDPGAGHEDEPAVCEGCSGFGTPGCACQPQQPCQ